MIPFAKIPANWRQPLFFVEFDNSQANSATLDQNTLIVGQMLSTGTTPANVPVLCTSPADAKTKCGIGSMLASMVWAYRQNDPNGQVWILPLADDGSAVKATGTITVTAVPTVAGSVYLYIAGQLVTVLLSVSMTVTTVAAAIVAAINALPDLPVTAANTAGVVTLTAKQGGLEGNDIDIRYNYLGVAGGQSLPVGYASTVVAMASGATNPTLTTGLSNCGDQPFDFIVNPYTDSASLNAFQSFLNDTTGRWSFNRQVYGHMLTALRGTVSALTTAGLARNDPHSTIVGFYDSPSPNWNWAAAVYGAVAVALKADPGRPCQELTVQAILAPPVATQFISSDREALLFSGIATYVVGPGSIIETQNIITTYQLNSFSQPDDSYLEIETLFQLMFLMRDLATFVTSTYPRMKLAADGTRLAPGVAVVTPTIVRNALISRYNALCKQGFAQNAAAFAQNIIVQKNTSNPNRLDVLWPGTLMDQLRVFALLAQFRLQ